MHRESCLRRKPTQGKKSKARDGRVDKGFEFHVYTFCVSANKMNLASVPDSKKKKRKKKNMKHCPTFQALVTEFYLKQKCELDLSASSLPSRSLLHPGPPLRRMPTAHLQFSMFQPALSQIQNCSQAEPDGNHLCLSANIFTQQLEYLHVKIDLHLWNRSHIRVFHVILFSFRWH